MSGTFGGRGTTFNLPSLKNGPNNPYYTIVDATTGKITLYEKELGGGLFGDSELGSIEATGPDKGKFIPGKDFNSALQADDRKLLLDGAAQKVIKNKAKETAQKGCEAASDGNTPEACATRTEQLLNNGEATTDPDATIDEITQTSLNSAVIKPVAGTRTKFGTLKYPLDMDGSQDFMMFSLLEYKPKDLLGSGLGAGERPRVGYNQKGGGRNILGTCSLPIQSGIKDQNRADWGENKMNALELATARLALTGLEGGPGAGKEIDNVKNALSENSGVAKKAVEQFFAGKMTGTTGLFARTKGATINPNLELLFNGPLLRPFSFQFRLSPRNKKEAEAVVRIIRFFKQGMSPIRTEGNLFLMAPHTFQVHFVHAPTNGEHPFIGKMKECALTSFSTDYTPENNYSTLKDGFMTSYTITMEFQELEPVYNDDYGDDEDSGFSSFREDPAENAALQATLPAKIGF